MNTSTSNINAAQESMPSLAGTSIGSVVEPEEEDKEHDNGAKMLFSTPEQQRKQGRTFPHSMMSSTSTNLIFPSQLVKEEEDSGILVEEGCNFVSKGYQVKLGQGLTPPTEEESPLFSPPSLPRETQVVSTPQGKDNAEYDHEEEDVPIQKSCHGGINLSPKQLADIFALFDVTSENWPPNCASHGRKNTEEASSTSSLGESCSNEGNDVTATPTTTVTTATTTVTSNVERQQPHQEPFFPGQIADSPTNQEEKLERECSALKEILRVDSINILKLKSVNYKLVTELAQLKPELAQIKRERDLLEERETQHLETVAILKEEVDKYTSATNSTTKKRELEQIQLQSELFASQIVEKEAEINEMQSTIEQLEADNARIKRELESSFKNDDTKMVIIDSENPSRYSPIPALPSVPTLSDLAERVQFLSDRLTNIEREHQTVTTPNQQHEQELENWELLDTNIEVTLSGDPFPAQVDGKEDNLGMLGTPRQSDKVAKQATKSNGGSLCDCFPFSHVSSVV